MCANAVLPNLILLMSDSLTPHFTGPYGDRAGSTPNLDRLAARGVVFDHAYCNSPLCAPSRASLVTGRYVSEIGSLDNANGFSSEWPTMAHALKKAGYETAIIGKMHLIGHDQMHGFDTRLALETDYSKGYEPDGYCMAYDWSQPSAGNPMGSGWMGESYVNAEQWANYSKHYDWDNEIHREAVDYLSKKSPGDTPFFCCVSYHHPHNPFWIPEDIRALFRDKDLPIPRLRADNRQCLGVMDNWLNEFHYVPEWQEVIWEEKNLRWLYETYYGMVHDMDSHIGELLNILRDRGLNENTAVVFTSDHGDMLGYRGMIQKRCFYDRSAKVPLIFSFPGRWREGIRIESPVSLVDLFPTFARFAGAEPPEDLPGKSILTAASEGTEPGERTIFCEYHGEGVHTPCFMALRGKMKYIYIHGYEERLYNLGDDPEEYVNRIGDERYAAIAGELNKDLLDKFDPETIAAGALQSQKNRKYILSTL